MRTRGKLLKDVPKCKACGCDEVRLVTSKSGYPAHVVRCADKPFHHMSRVLPSAEEAIADWRKLNAPETAA